MSLNKAVIIEDAGHAIAAKYIDGSIGGNCRFSKMTIFSFHSIKDVASGEGGMITTNYKQLFLRLLKLCNHGIHKGNFDFPGIIIADNSIMNSKRALENEELRTWYDEIQELGYNCRYPVRIGNISVEKNYLIS